MNKLYLIVTLIAPIFGFFGTIARWFKPQENKPAMHEQIRRNLIVKNIYPYSSYGKQEKSLGVDELGIKVPDIPSFGERHDRVRNLVPLIDRGPLKPLSDLHTSYNKQIANENEWNDYLKKRHKKIYHNHKMGIDKYGEPYRLEDDNG